jgi:alkylhydroperoxidase family enzyme
MGQYLAMAPDETPWIETVPDDAWTGELASLHEQVVDREHGRVDHIMAIHSLNPRGLAAHNALYGSAMAGTGSLRKVERELIALVVSLENHCHY